MTTSPEIAAGCSDVAPVFRVLGELYLRSPSNVDVESVSTWAGQWQKTSDASFPPELRDGLSAIATVDMTRRDELAASFTRLFRGVSQTESPRPPYESLYRDGSLFGSSTVTVREHYRAAGFDLADGEGNELADHVGIELQFLGELAAREATAFAAGNDDECRDLRNRQREFIDDHLSVWFDDLRDAVEAANPPSFYRGVLAVTSAVLAERSAELDDDAPDNP